MAVLDVILTVILVLLVFFLVYFLLNLFIKMTPYFRNKTDFWFQYRFIPRRIKRPDCKKSKYWNKAPLKLGEYWSTCPTIDDPFLEELAQNIKNTPLWRFRTERSKASYILKLVQYGYMYQSDKKTYGKDEKWAFPVCTSYLHIGDCEDGALLGAGLSYLCGLDTVMVSMKGHALYGVNVWGIGMSVKHNNRKYLLCETTNVLPLGLTLNSKIQGAFTIIRPTDQWIQRCVVEDDFNKYLP